MMTQVSFRRIAIVNRGEPAMRLECAELADPATPG